MSQYTHPRPLICAELLESRRLFAVTVTGTVTLDESSGLQTGGAAVTGEDNNDNDVTLGTLQTQAATFYNRLFSSPAAGLGLATTFPTAIGVGKSGDGFITVTEPGTIVSLGFSKTDGTALPVFGGADPGVASGLSAATGGAITLFADPVLGSRMVIGVDTAGDKVLALFLDPNGTLTSAKVWTAQFEPLSNPVTTDFDDPVTLAGLGVAAGVSTEFDFDDLPSGQNLFGALGDAASGLIIIGRNPVLNADGTYTNASNTINTSKGGGATTIGVNNQMFDAGEGAFFTFVKQPDTDFLGTALDANEADDADNIQYDNGTLEVTSGFLDVVQRQGSGALRMRLSTFNMAGSPQGTAFVSAVTGAKPAVNITQVQVNGVTVFTGSQASVEVNIAAGDRVSWTTSTPHDVVRVEGVAGKFDIGGFGTTQATTAVAPLSGVRYEDDGPAVTGQGALVTLTVDETTLATNATADADDFINFNDVFGQDGSGTTTVSYALATPPAASGLVDTASGQNVVLSLVGGQIEGRTAVGSDLVFTLSVNSSTGVMTLDQIRAIVHPDATSHDESKSVTFTNLLVGTATTTDKDGDTVQASVGDDVTLVFKDDGPSITATIVGAPTLSVDESTLATNANGAFAAQFSPTFGADGQGATPVTYALSTPGGNSGLVDTASGDPVFLFKVGDNVVGKAGDDATQAASGPVVFIVSVNASGQVTLDQQRSIKHDDAAAANDTKTLSAANLVVLTGTAHDKDLDTAPATLNIGQQLVFTDDAPTIGPIGNSIVDFLAGATSGTKTLAGAVGADPNASPYTVDSFTQSITVNGVLVKGVASASNTVVTYYADTNGDTVFGNAGDTAFFQLTLNQAGAGTYKFDVLATPPPAETEFNFGDLPSGQNLFGIIGDPAAGLVIIGKVPVLNADGTYTNASNTINTSKGGGGTTIGVNNQMFDPGEGAYFTFVKDPNANFLGTALDANEADDADNIQYKSTAPGTLEVDNGFLDVVQSQGNAGRSMRLSTFNMANQPQGKAFVTAVTGAKPAVNITEVKVNGVVVFSGSQGSVVVNNINAGDRVSWKTSGLHDVVLVEGVSGKFDIGGFGTTQGAPTPDQKLDFVVKATDGDGDSATSGFSIGIDGTGPFDDGIVTGVATVSSLLFGSEPMDELEELLA